MAKRIFGLGMLVLVLAFGMAVIGCGGNPLQGTWAWDIDHSYTYVFNADGTGSRGFPGALETFTWSTSGDELRIGGERWTFNITGNVLTIVSRQVEGMVYSYIRR